MSAGRRADWERSAVLRSVHRASCFFVPHPPQFASGATAHGPYRRTDHCHLLLVSDAWFMVEAPG